MENTEANMLIQDIEQTEKQNHQQYNKISLHDKKGLINQISILLSKNNVK